MLTAGIEGVVAGKIEFVEVTFHTNPCPSTANDVNTGGTNYGETLQLRCCQCNQLPARVRNSVRFYSIAES